MSKSRSYQVPVVDIGTFTFRRRTMGDFVRIPNMALELLGGVPQHPYLLEQATMLAELQTLTVAAPEGWDVGAMDPLDDEDVARVRAVHGRLLAEEARFRGGAAPARPVVGPGDEPDGGVRVPAPVQPPAD